MRLAALQPAHVGRSTDAAAPVSVPHLGGAALPQALDSNEHDSGLLQYQSDNENDLIMAQNMLCEVTFDHQILISKKLQVVCMSEILRERNVREVKVDF